MKKIFFILFLLLSVHLQINAQIIINKPTLGFSQACASSSFNTFNISFTFFPAANLGAGNQFIIELSDGNGSFAAPTVLKTLPNTISPVATTFSFPTTVSGDNYTIRVRSTNPAAVSPVSNVFPAYYAIYNQVFTINNNVSNLTLCKSQSITLSIDPGVNSPLQYPQLKYRWFKNNVVIPGETSSSIVITQSATYYVAIDYGLCNYNSYSNQVAVALVDIDPTIQNQDLTDLVCIGSPKRINCLVQNIGYGYVWYKDGVVIPGASTYFYDALSPGIYKVVVSNLGCSFTSNEITLIGPSVSASIASPPLDLIIPGQTKTFTVTSNALSPSYIWYRNGVPIPGAISATLNATSNGVYKVVVRQNQTCIAEAERQVELQYPLGFELNIFNELPYQPCVSTSASLVIDKFNALTTSVPISILGNTYNYTYRWYRNGVLVPGANATSLLVSNALDNGTYKLGVLIPDFPEVFSNSIEVQLPVNEDITVSRSGTFCVNGDVFSLQSKLTNLNYTFDWYFNGSLVSTTNSNSFSASQSGSYHLIVRSGSCFLQSNSILVQELSFNASISAVPNALLIPGGQVTINTATDALQPTYLWHKDNLLLGAEISSSLNVTQPGDYKVTIKQNQGCVLSKDLNIKIEYPSSFTVAIMPSSGFQECVNANTVLSLSQFIANSSLGNVDLISNPYNYTFQWYKNNSPIPGATKVSLPVNDLIENADYKLEVIIPNFSSVFSNVFTLKLGFSTPLVIATSDVFCDSNSLVNITSNYSDSRYTYEWFESSDTTVLGTQSSIVVSKSGSYTLIVSFNGCSVSSNVLTILPFDYSQITVDAPESFSIQQGETRIITATGADSYQWFVDNQLVSISNSYKVTQAGVYVLKAKIGVCELTKTFTVDYKNSSIVIPNTVTLNGDGYNDFWAIPIEYAYKEEVRIVIYNSNGGEVLNTTNYQNNWPQSNFEFSKMDSVYYYTIQINQEITKRGSITFVK
jgi:gliding motility-associated-like protein